MSVGGFTDGLGVGPEQHAGRHIAGLKAAADQVGIRRVATSGIGWAGVSSYRFPCRRDRQVGNGFDQRPLVLGDQLVLEYGLENRKEMGRCCGVFVAKCGDRPLFEGDSLCLLYTSPSPRDRG